MERGGWCVVWMLFNTTNFRPLHQARLLENRKLPANSKATLDFNSISLTFAVWNTYTLTVNRFENVTKILCCVSGSET